MTKKHRKVCTTSNCTEQLLILASAITGCVSFFTFVSLVGIPVGVTTSLELKISAITAEIKKYQSIIKKRGRSMTKQYCSEKIS